MPTEKPTLRSLPKPERKSPSGFPNMVSGDWLDAQIFPELEYAVPGIIPEGSTMLVGPPKAGKSWLVLSLALSVAQGSPALGSIPLDNSRPVLMLALEDGHRRFQSRCRTILGKGVPIPSDLHVVTNIDPKTLFAGIENFLYEHEDEKPLVVLDTLGKVMPPQVSGESAYQRDYRIGSDVKRLTDNYPGSSFISIHHDRKAESNDFVDAVSGTHGLAGAADTIILLERDRQSAEGLLKVTGRDVDENEYAIVNDGGRWALNGASLDQASTQSGISKAKMGVGDKSQQIIDFVAQHDPCATSAVVKEFGQSAKVYLKRLNDSGRIVRKGYGEYGIPTSQRNIG